MAGDSRLSARFGADTTDFKNGITEINRELRVVESGFRASAAALGDWSEDATGLEMRMGALTEKIGLQGEKVGALTVQYEQVVAAHGENSVEAQNAEINLNRETEALNRMQTELRETEGALEDMKGGNEELEESSGGVSLSLTDVKSAFEMAAQAARYVKQAYEETVGVTLEYARTVGDLSRALGISAEEASRLIQVGDDLKIEQNTLEMAFRNLIDSGVQPTTENLKSLAATYQGMTDPVDQAQFAMDKFGKKAGQEMQKLLELTGDELDAMAQSAEDAGLVMSEEAVEAAREYEESLDDLDDAVQGAKISIGTELIPVLQDGIEFTNASVTSWRSLIKVLGDLQKGVVPLEASYEGYAAAVDEANKFNTTANLTVQILTAGLVNLGLGVDKLTEAEFEAQQATVALAEAQAEGDAALAELTEEVMRNLEAQEAANDELVKSAPVYSGYVQSVLDATGSTMNFVSAAEAEQRALEAVQFAIQGPVQAAYGDYVMTIDAVKLEHDELAAQLEVLKAQGYEETSAKVLELTGKLAENEAQQATLEGQLEETITQIIYEKAAMDLDAAAALELGRQMGLVSETDYNLATALDTLADKFDTNYDGLVDATEASAGYYDALEDLRAKAADGVLTLEEVKDVLDKLDGAVSETELHVNVTGDAIPPSLYEVNPDDMQGGYAAGGYGVVPGGYPADSYKIGLSSGEKFFVLPPGETAISGVTLEAMLAEVGVGLQRAGGVDMGLMAGGGERAVSVDNSRHYHLMAQYAYQDERSLRDELRLLALMG